MAADQDSRDSIEVVLAEFDGKKEILDAFCERTKALLEECLKDAGIRYQSVQARRKRREKLRLKYLDPQKNYRKLNDITDQAALRVITYYEDEIDRVADVIKREFEIDPERSVDKRESEPDRFGYYALNLICRHAGRRRSDVEYKRFADVNCEIQITSVLRHAWSEIEHDWYDLRNAYPPAIKRRFYQLAALLGLAESEFMELRNKKSTYEQSVAIQVEANVPDVPIDAVSLGSFIEQEPLVASLDADVAAARKLPLSDSDVRTDSVRMILLSSAGITTIQDLREKLSKYEASLRLYIRRWSDEVLNEHLPASSLPKGVSTHYLAMLLIAERGGSEYVMKALNAAGFQQPIPYSVDDQVRVAHEVLRQVAQV